MPGKKIRLTLDVSEELNKTLDNLAERGGTTKADILRRAIALMEIAVHAKERGQRIGLADPEQTLATELVVV